ncbi:glycerophosphodiester phosphodiesterase family protein [Bradyrhizobium sp. WD16]|uniref:glycerophosphodiester phosphodiesterase family protein n=1 Tax=Bradyrhizobium sp. WD16 TaxID=1521768 RepID=UPI0020A4C0F9|nr:glycerophosphodiester phosphodiesterase family protein [Bradyrhizobium sp. WD16]UTD27514.1 hypothetical protein DB459_11845 [Bradyrhizobium sp. WD16]
MQPIRLPKRVACNGLPDRVPEGILDGFLAAYTLGADLLLLDLGITKDGELVAGGARALQRMGVHQALGDLSLEEIKALDAGLGFQGRFEQGESVVAGQDTPWIRHGRQPVTSLATVFEVLLQLEGVMPVIARLDIAPGNARQTALDRLAKLTDQFDLAPNFGVATDEAGVAEVRTRCPHATPVLICPSGGNLPDVRDRALAGGMPVLVSYDEALAAIRGAPSAPVGNTSFPGAGDLVVVPGRDQRTTSATLARLQTLPSVWGIGCSDLMNTAVCPPLRGELFADSLREGCLDRQHWVAGYSRSNPDTTWSCTLDGFRVEVCQGGSYSGAGLVLAWPVRGDFEVQVEFDVSKPAQGTTLELCAINVNPGAFQNKPGEGRQPDHPAFDVHGGSPYVGTERDEDDGFRAICSRGSTILTEGRQNVYNFYGRDVGNPDARKGILRLVRRGVAWASFYCDENNPDWMGCGCLVNASMNSEVYVRMAAKHWIKDGKPAPANVVHFRSFMVSRR